MEIIPVHHWRDIVSKTCDFSPPGLLLRIIRGAPCDVMYAPYRDPAGGPVRRALHVGDCPGSFVSNGVTEAIAFLPQKLEAERGGQESRRAFVSIFTK